MDEPKLQPPDDASRVPATEPGGGASGTTKAPAAEPSSVPSTPGTWRERAMRGSRDLRRRNGWLVDRVWPQVEPQEPEQIARDAEKRAKLLDDQLASVERAIPTLEHRDAVKLTEAMLDAAKSLVEHEAERRRGIEARLTTVLGFVTLASSIAIAATGYRMSATQTADHAYLATVASLIMLYAVMQIICAARAAVSGLGRRQYEEPRPATILAAKADLNARKDLIKAYVRYAAAHDASNNSKLDDLAVAHEAVTNFVGAVGVLMLVATLAALGALGERPSDGAEAQSGPDRAQPLTQADDARDGPSEHPLDGGATYPTDAPLPTPAGAAQRSDEVADSQWLDAGTP